MEAFICAGKYPGSIVYLFRESYDDLEPNLIEAWKEFVPQELYDYSATKHVATLANGSRVYFRYMDANSDADNYRGRSMDFIGIDELTFTMNGRSRSSFPVSGPPRYE